MMHWRFLIRESHLSSPSLFPSSPPSHLFALFFSFFLTLVHIFSRFFKHLHTFSLCFARLLAFSVFSFSPPRTSFSTQFHSISSFVALFRSFSHFYTHFLHTFSAHRTLRLLTLSTYFVCAFCLYTFSHFFCAFALRAFSRRFFCTLFLRALSAR